LNSAPPTSKERIDRSSADVCQRSYGFTVDPDTSPKQNYDKMLSEGDTDPTIFVRPNKQQMHNLCNNPNAVPKEMLDLLGNGLGHVVATKRRQENPIDFQRLRQNMRIKCMNLPPNPFCNLRLHVPKTEWQPNEAPEEVENATNAFEQATTTTFLSNRKRKGAHNVSSKMVREMKQLKKE